MLQAKMITRRNWALPWPKLFDLYIFREFLGPFLLILSGFCLIGMFDVIFSYVDWFVNRGIALPVILRLLVYKVPAVAILYMPMVTLFATMLVLIRLTKDSELVVFRTSGLSLGRIAVPLVVLGLLVSLFSVFLYEEVVPWTNHTSQDIIRRIIFRQPLPQIEANKFFQVAGQRYFYIQQIDKKANAMKGIMIYELPGGQYPKIITAQSGVWRDNKWILSDGAVHNFDWQGQLTLATSFREMTIDVSDDIDAMLYQQNSPWEMTSRQLRQQIVDWEKGGGQARDLRIELYLKRSLPVANLIFLMVGTALCITFIKSFKDWWGMVAAITISILSVGFFMFLSAASRALGRGGFVSPWWAAWLPDLIYGVSAAAFIGWEWRHR